MTSQLKDEVARLQREGHDVIALGVGEPDLPPPSAGREAFAAAVRRPDLAGYPTVKGEDRLRQAVAAFYRRRFGVEVDAEREVLPLLGAKEGLLHLGLTLLDPGDVALLPDPGYPVYMSAAAIAGARGEAMPLLAANRFLPDVDAIDADAAAAARMAIVSYPNNPTGGVADVDVFERFARFCVERGIVAVSDSAYTEITFDDYVAPSFLQAPSAREAGIEVLSMSKTFSAPGWRAAFAVGNAEVIAALQRLKTHVDAGMFRALQHAVAGLLDGHRASRAEVSATYQRRRDIVCDALEAAGVPVSRPKGGMFVWAPTPAGESALDFARRVARQAHVVVAAGSSFGPTGEGFFRLSLGVDDRRLREAMDRLVPLLRQTPGDDP
jgi:LL-diaminopimelate aminotransferase